MVDYLWCVLTERVDAVFVQRELTGTKYIRCGIMIVHYVFVYVIFVCNILTNLLNPKFQITITADQGISKRRLLQDAVGQLLSAPRSLPLVSMGVTWGFSNLIPLLRDTGLFVRVTRSFSQWFCGCLA